MDLSNFAGLAGIPFVIALVEVVKMYTGDRRLYPLAGIAFGVAINVGIALALATGLLLAVLVGVLTGLAASGIYSSGKAVTGN